MILIQQQDAILQKNYYNDVHLFSLNLRFQGALFVVCYADKNF